MSRGREQFEDGYNAAERDLDEGGNAARMLPLARENRAKARRRGQRAEAAYQDGRVVRLAEAVRAQARAEADAE